MVLSVIIVSYNVRYFLEQCLLSVMRASEQLDVEIWVVDNDSADGTADFLQPQFPAVHFIRNKVNAGFGKACNQALAKASGEYVLFLNPDTILQEDTLTAALAFMQSGGADATGIRMVDGRGRFLRESKRAFPSPLTSLFKLTGLAGMFPRSSFFARYHLGHLNEMQSSEVDVLSGAFMLIRKDVLDVVGGFDEQFFMYGEDIDLSYRIQHAGFRNFYFAGSTIIHFKGESTRKATANYVKMFYRAMSVFVRKHYAKKHAGLFVFFIHFAIWLRGLLSGFATLIRRVGLPLIDAILMIAGFWLTKLWWNHFIKSDTIYEVPLLWLTFICLTLIYLFTGYFAGLYDRYYRWNGLLRPASVATIVVLAAYSLLPEEYRFSRGVILIGSAIGFALIMGGRALLRSTGVLPGNRLPGPDTMLIAGSDEDYKQVLDILQRAATIETAPARIDFSMLSAEELAAQIASLTTGTTPAVQEIIFCITSVPLKELIEILPRIPSTVGIRLYTSGAAGIIGSESSNRSGEVLSAFSQFNIAHASNRRYKRLIDVVVSDAGLLTWPIQCLLVKKPVRFAFNSWNVLMAKATWVGYAATTNPNVLPVLPRAVLSPSGAPTATTMHNPGQDAMRKLDEWYAREYDAGNDLRIILANYRNLGS